MKTINKLKSIMLTGVLSISMIGFGTTANQEAFAASNKSTKVVYSYDKYRVVAKSTKVRAKASSTGKTIATLKQGAEVNVISSNKTWSQVNYKGSKSRWIKTKDLEKIYVPQPRQRVIAANTVMKDSPNSKSKTLRSLKKNSVVFDIRKTSGNWTKVEDGHYEGWVLTKYLR